MSIKFIYTLFIGILFATFIGVGISAFYPGPEIPEYQTLARIESPPSSDDPKYQEFQKQERVYQEKMEEYQKKQNIYNRNVSTIALVISVLALVISLTYLKGIDVLADGLLLGGLLVLIYSITRGFTADDNMFRFIVVTVGFTVSLGLGYIKFIKPKEKKK